MKTPLPLAIPAITLAVFINMTVTHPAYSLPPTNQKTTATHQNENSEEPPPYVVKRRLLHTENQNDTTTSQVDHRDNFELFATIVGVLGGVTLITGFVAFTWGLAKKQKERVERAVERETSRRTEEGRLLNDLFEHKHSPAMIPFGSTTSIAPVQQLPQRESSTTQEIPGLQEAEPATVETETEAEPKAETPEGEYTLQEAIQAVIGEDASLVVQILTGNPDYINQPDENGNTLLHHAKDAQIVRLLLRRGAKLNSANNLGFTPVHVAAIEENQTILALLLDWMEAIPFDDLSTLFHIAAHSDHSATLNYLVKRGLHKGLHFQRRRLAAIRTSQQSIQTLSGSTLLHEAVSDNNLGVVVYLLGARLINPNATDNYGNTPLHLAALSLQINKAYEQSQQNPDPRETIIGALLQAGADINAVNSEGQTPLHRAVLRNNAATVSILLKNKPDLGIEANGQTAVELACLRNYGVIVILLAPHSRLRGQRRRQQLLQQLIRLNQVNTLNALTQETARRLFDVNAPDDEGNTPLHTACRDRRSDIVGALISLGAKNYAVNRQGQTPRDIANKRRRHIARPILEALEGVPANTQPEAAL